MTTLSWPAFSIDPTRTEWWFETLTQEHRSPLTGAVQTQELLGARWSTRVEYHNLGEADARLAWAFIGSMRGRAASSRPGTRRRRRTPSPRARG